jgi:hypothetical protein
MTTAAPKLRQSQNWTPIGGQIWTPIDNQYNLSASLGDLGKLLELRFDP